MAQSHRYSTDVVEKDDDTELLRKLKKAWGYDSSSPLRVIGKLFKRSTPSGNAFNFLGDLRSTVTFDNLEYPIEIDRSGRNIDIIYVQPSDAKTINQIADKGDWVIANVAFSPKSERAKKGNLFALMVESNIDVLRELPDAAALEMIIGDKTYIEHKVVDFYRNKHSDEIDSANQQLSIKAELEHKAVKERYDNQSSKFETDIKKLIESKSKLQAQLDSSDQEKQQLEKKVAQLSQTVSRKSSELSDLESSYSSRKNTMESNLKRLNNFVTDRAEQLSKLDLVSDSDLDTLLGRGSAVEDDKPSVSFSEAMDGDFEKSVSYIQSYLYAKDIYYKKSLLKDFFALIRTNDLVILAGDSGSGKTNLVKAMADAVGGESIIIPVKPNWTGSEDLLGYYNPLEKKYLSTPFLDALIKASKHPETPYFICLDEMNLARVEYYFADFLSLLEERSESPEIYLYSDSEADHTLAEFNTFLKLTDSVISESGKEDVDDYISLLKDEAINSSLNKICGFNGGDSLIKYHAHLRRLLSGFLNTPSSIRFPENVRVIGAINVDETTHYLSPKILDRAHVVRFGSPLLGDFSEIEKEIEQFENLDGPLKFDICDMGIRASYPKFDRSQPFASFIIEITEKFLDKLGLEVGFRTVRQALNYREELLKFEDNEDIIINNFIRHKILPKMMFDGEISVGETTKKDVLSAFKEFMAQRLSSLDGMAGIDYCVDEIERVIENARANNWVVNYWSK